MAKFTHYQQEMEQMLVRNGLAPDVAASISGTITAWQIARVAGLERILESTERDAHIYHLRGQRLTVEVIGMRVCLCRSKVHEAIRRDQKARRAALRVA